MTDWRTWKDKWSGGEGFLVAEALQYAIYIYIWSFMHLPLSNNSEIIIQLNASILNVACRAPPVPQYLRGPASEPLRLLAISVCCRFSICFKVVGFLLLLLLGLFLLPLLL